MKQEYDQYTQEHEEVWNTLYTRQAQNLETKASPVFLDCLKRLDGVIDGSHIPHFNRIDAALNSTTGWTIEVVPGIIPVADFFELLSRRRFCSSTWLRSKAQLDYLEEPDMFHDIFGHVPLLLHPRYADFMQEVGRIGYACRKDPDLLDAMERLYWYSIEFGLVTSPQGNRIYGAGTLSSFGETNAIFEVACDIRAFDLDEILAMPFTKSELQTKYYVIDSMDELFASLEFVANRTS